MSNRIPYNFIEVDDKADKDIEEVATINIAHCCFIIVRVLIKSLFYMTRPGAAGDRYQGARL